MSAQLSKVVSMGIHSTFDLFVGTGLASLIDAFFKAHPPKSDSSGTVDKFSLAFSCAAQAFVTVLAAEEIRNLAWAEPGADPTGGIIFIVGVLFQPTLWYRMIEQFYPALLKDFMLSSAEQAVDSPSRGSSITLPNQNIHN